MKPSIAFLISSTLLVSSCTHNGQAPDRSSESIEDVEKIEELDFDFTTHVGQVQFGGSLYRVVLGREGRELSPMVVSERENCDVGLSQERLSTGPVKRVNGVPEPEMCWRITDGGALLGEVPSGQVILVRGANLILLSESWPQEFLDGFQGVEPFLAPILEAALSD